MRISNQELIDLLNRIETNNLKKTNNGYRELVQRFAYDLMECRMNGAKIAQELAKRLEEKRIINETERLLLISTHA